MVSRDRDPDDKKAAVVFAAGLTVAAGAAGLVVAGLVLGLDYMLRGEPDERDQLAERRAARRLASYEAAQAWLEADDARRAAAAERVREWRKQDPATRGEMPSDDSGMAHKLGRWTARLWYGGVVGVGRFRKGWKAGTGQARQRRENGDPNWWIPRRDPSDGPQPSAPPDSEPTAPPVDPRPKGTPRPDSEVEPNAARRQSPDPPSSAPNPPSRQVMPAPQGQQRVVGGDGIDDALDALEGEIVTGPPGGDRAIGDR